MGQSEIESRVRGSENKSMCVFVSFICACSRALLWLSLSRFSFSLPHVHTLHAHGCMNQVSDGEKAVGFTWHIEYVFVEVWGGREAGRQAGRGQAEGLKEKGRGRGRKGGRENPLSV